MKATLLSVIFAAFLSSAAYTQTISNVPLKEVQVEYILIRSVGTFNNKIAIDLDFGQSRETFKMKNNMLLNEDEKPIEFNSIMDAINFLARYGYELLEAYVVPTEMSGYPYYIMKRKKES